MSYPAAKAAIVEALEGVEGLKYVIGEEPTAIHDCPMMYLILGDFERTDTVQPAVYRYTILGSLVIRWQDNSQAEAEIDALLNPIAEAFAGDPTVGGAVNGAVTVTGGDAGFAQIGGTTYRVVEFGIEVNEIYC
jgi:hypothetical protein